MLSRDILIKLLTRAERIAVVVLITASLLKLFGFSVFDVSLSNSRLTELFYVIDQNEVLTIAIKMVVTQITFNMIYMSYIAFSKKRYLVLNGIILAYSAVLQILIQTEVSEITVMVLSLIPYFAIIMYRNELSVVVEVILLDGILQSASLFIRGTTVEYAVSGSAIYVFMMDYYAFLFIYMARMILSKRERSILIWLYGALVDFGFKRLKSWRLRKESYRAPQHNTGETFEQSWRNRSAQLTQRLKSWSVKVKVKSLLLDHYLKYDVFPAVTIVGTTLLYAYMLGKVPQALILIAGFISLRYVFPKTFHADYIPGIEKRMILYVCTALTTTTFIVALNQVRVNSMFSPLLVAMVIDTFLYFVRDYIDVTSPAARLKYRCLLAGIKAEDIPFMVDYMIHNQSLEAQAEKYGIERQSVGNKRTRLKKKLESNKSNK